MPIKTLPKLILVCFKGVLLLLTIKVKINTSSGNCTYDLVFGKPCFAKEKYFFSPVECYVFTLKQTVHT